MIDDPVLTNDWHVVARSSDTGKGEVRATRLLGRDLVLWRGNSNHTNDDNDSLCAWQDLCVHPGARLSGGRVWAAALAYVLDRRFLHAAGWLLAGAVLASFGVIHAYDLSSAGIVNKLGIFVAPEFAISYAAAALFLAGCHFYNRRFPSPKSESI